MWQPILLVVALAFCAAGVPARAADNEAVDETGLGAIGRSTDLLRATRIRPRINLYSRGMIDGDFGDADVSWVRSGGSMLVALPLSKQFILLPRFSGSIVNWDFDGDSSFLKAGQTSGDPFDDLIGLRFRLDARYAFGEHWASLASVSLSSDYEDGASFGDGRRVGGSVAVSYTEEGKFQLMLGVSVREKMTRDSVSIAPVFYGRWRPYKWLRLETEGMGLRATARLRKEFRVFAFGGLRSERHRLDDRNDGPNGVRAGSIRDRRVLAGVGAEWRALRWLRLEADAGAVAWQQLRVITEDNDRFDTETMDDPAPFVSLRAQLRF